MTQKQLDKKELQEILELCKVADQNMKEIGGNVAVILEKTQQWSVFRQTTSSGKE
jgi:hypothetical protein